MSWLLAIRVGSLLLNGLQDLMFVKLALS
ncbi:hypothetical protein CGRA01v4_13001 [Colletotrichum graminicola]|nr:hypothetical protein CGRA01v4_13001 [Colletotrichum graminicola]